MSSLPPVPTFIATSLLGLGLCRLFAPRAAYRLFGLPLSPNSSPSPFLYASAGRELALGLTYALLGLQGNWEGLKALMIGTVIAAQVDAFTVWYHGGAEFGGWRGKWIGHFLGGFILGIMVWKDLGV